MAANPHRKLVPGERLESIPAAAWNGFVDVATAYREGRLQKTDPSRDFDREAARTLVLVRNDSGSAVGRFSVMQVSGIGISPTDNLAHFKNRPYLSVDVPSADLTSVVGVDAFVITQSPLAAGAIGPGLISGISPCQVDNLASGVLTYVDMIAGDETQLQTVPWGCASIVANTVGSDWCYVMLNGFSRRPWFGIADSAIADGATGDVSVYIGGTDSGINAECVAGFGAIESGDLVYVVPRSPEWYIIQAPCPA